MLKPLGDRLLVLPDPKQNNETYFGILLPEDNKPPATGVVVVGDKEIKKGSRIMFSLYAIDEVKIDDKPHVIVSKSGVLGVFE